MSTAESNLTPKNAAPAAKPPAPAAPFDLAAMIQAAVSTAVAQAVAQVTGNGAPAGAKIKNPDHPKRTAILTAAGDKTAIDPADPNHGVAALALRIEALEDREMKRHPGNLGTFVPARDTEQAPHPELRT